MDDHAYSFYCKDKYWQRCDDENLEIVEVLDEKHNEDGDLSRKEVIYRCRVCGGFYRQQYRATYYPSHLFDTEEGWDITNNYFRIEEPRWKTPGSTLDVPLTIHEARQFGYTGEDHSWKNRRCNFPVQNVELTCRTGDLQFVADATPNAWDHLRNKLYKCKRCGEWYLFTPLPPFPQGFFKPSNELFPLDTARLYGYEEKEELKNNEEKEFQASQADFDALAQKANETGAIEDLNALFGAVFALPELIFVRFGTPPNVDPYITPNPALAGSPPMACAFTDLRRLGRFAGENNLLQADGSCKTLQILTKYIVEYLESLVSQGVQGIWLNSGSQSTGFFILTKQLRLLSEHFSKSNSITKKAIKTLQVIVQEALLLSPDNVRETPYKVNFFCRVPADWVENGRLKAEFWKKIADQIFGENRDAETFPGGRYIIKHSQTEIFEDRQVKNRTWGDVGETEDLYYFFIGSEHGEAKKVTAQEFQANIEAEMSGA